MAESFTTVTEATGCNVSREQIKRMYTRYRFAAEQCPAGAQILEVACGSGQGLGYLAKKAQAVHAIDIDDALLAAAKRHYAATTKISIAKGDAHKLSFADASLDAVLLYEAIYYLPHPEQFAAEAFRVLKKGGKLLICSANSELPDFNPSPYSQKYFSASELHKLMTDAGFAAVKLFANCRVDDSAKGKFLSAVKKTAVKLNLMPKTMRGKEWLKRVVFGSLVPLPAELDDGMADYDKPEPIAPGIPNTTHKVIFAVGEKS
ncbi:MAG TPA: class I SAM-dependent methyltransferase [Elusimicrobiales bacterium]|nr:class I SAM-dependent methyltransferase [Elusimicrobiales bacterium]